MILYTDKSGDGVWSCRLSPGRRAEGEKVLKRGMLASPWLVLTVYSLHGSKTRLQTALHYAERDGDALLPVYHTRRDTRPELKIAVTARPAIGVWLARVPGSPQF